MPKTALDLGSGRGFHTAVLARRYQTTGVDDSDENIALSRARYPRVAFRQMDAKRLDFPDCSFDLIDAFDVLEHVDDLSAVAFEISRVLKPGGLLRISVPAENSERWLLRLRPTYHDDIHHVRIFKDGELNELFKPMGLTLRKLRRRGSIQHLELYFMFKRNLAGRSQVSVGDWRDNVWTRLLHVFVLLFDKEVLYTPIKYTGIWLITLPVGFLLGLVGNQLFPKSIYLEFVK